MSPIEAVYRDGVFKPLTTITLENDQRVRLIIQPIQESSVKDWLNNLRQVHESIIARSGHLPDSTGDIAADRKRGL